MLRLTRQRSLRAVVDWLKITVVSDPVSFDLERVMQAATAYQARHGDLKVPAEWEQDGLLLGVELDKLRRQARADRNELDQLLAHTGDEQAARAAWLRAGPRVHPDLVAYLEQLGFAWEPRARGRALLLAAARAYADAHGHLLPRRDESVDVNGQSVPLGALLAERRRPGVRDTELEAIGVWQVPDDVPWTAAWHRQLVRLEQFKTEGGTRAELLHGERLYRGEDLAAWLHDQHVRWNELRPQKQEALTALHMDPVPTDAQAGAQVPVARRGRKERLPGGRHRSTPPARRHRPAHRPRRKDHRLRGLPARDRRTPRPATQTPLRRPRPLPHLPARTPSPPPRTRPPLDQNRRLTTKFPVPCALHEMTANQEVDTCRVPTARCRKLGR
ncbi:helicase associated domain-containing protein [Streptomyces melanogenes]|uniref:helicase associated domain-containing protein n=1 Tax=Streptomyces melanogenes TaxID=67326 RepID=UPI0037881899